MRTSEVLFLCVKNRLITDSITIYCVFQYSIETFVFIALIKSANLRELNKCLVITTDTALHSFKNCFERVYKVSAGDIPEHKKKAKAVEKL